MDAELEYLLSFLEQEFAGDPDIRVRLSPRAGTKRSVDLVQDYDASSASLHKERGVFVKSVLFEYYFPAEWVREKQFSKLYALVDEIKERKS